MTAEPTRERLAMQGIYADHSTMQSRWRTLLPTRMLDVFDCRPFLQPRVFKLAETQKMPHRAKGGALYYLAQRHAL